MSETTNKARDFEKTVAEVLAAIPEAEVKLRADIEHVRESAFYQAPEAFRGWHEISAVLTRAIGEVRNEWADRVFEIWTGKVRSDG